MSIATYIRRKPENPEVQPYIVDRIDPDPANPGYVYVIFEGDGDFSREYHVKVEGLHVAKGFLYLKGNYYAPEEWDRLYVRVGDVNE